MQTHHLNEPHAVELTDGLRIIFSTDADQTWIGPHNEYGYLVILCYGYGKTMELPDGNFPTHSNKTPSARTPQAQQT